MDVWYRPRIKRIILDSFSPRRQARCGWRGESYREQYAEGKRGHDRARSIFLTCRRTSDVRAFAPRRTLRDEGRFTQAEI
jgi:hypothetical protein